MSHTPWPSPRSVVVITFVAAAFPFFSDIMGLIGALGLVRAESERGRQQRCAGHPAGAARAMQRQSPTRSPLLPPHASCLQTPVCFVFPLYMWMLVNGRSGMSAASYWAHGATAAVLAGAGLLATM